MATKPLYVFDLDSATEAIAGELGLPVGQVKSAIGLLDDGNTIPFIARYRKEATSGLDEIALRSIEDSLEKSRALAVRKATVLKTIDEQGSLTEDLRRQIETCTDRLSLEAIYLPFKPKRRSRATLARQRGLQPLADLLLRQELLQHSKQQTLQRYVDPKQDLPDTATALQGAMDIIAEQWSEDATTRSWLRDRAYEDGESHLQRSNAERRTKQASTNCTSTTGNPSRRFPHIVCWRCYVVNPKVCYVSVCLWMIPICCFT